MPGPHSSLALTWPCWVHNNSFAISFKSEYNQYLPVGPPAGLSDQTCFECCGGSSRFGHHRLVCSLVGIGVVLLGGSLRAGLEVSNNQALPNLRHSFLLLPVTITCFYL